MCPGLHPMSTCMTLDPTHMLSVSNGRCIKLAQPSRQTWSCIPVQTDPCSFRRSSPAASGGVVGCGGALLGVQCASGDNNGGACVAGSVPPLAPNTAESSPRLFSPPPTPTHYLAFCVSLSSVPTCPCLSALLFVCFFLSSAHKGGYSALALVGGRENAAAAQIFCSWDGSAVCRRLRGHCFPPPLWEMAALQRLDRPGTGGEGSGVQSHLLNTHVPASDASFGSWRLSGKGRVASLGTVPTVPSLVRV